MANLVYSDKSTVAFHKNWISFWALKMISRNFLLAMTNITWVPVSTIRIIIFLSRKEYLYKMAWALLKRLGYSMRSIVLWIYDLPLKKVLFLRFLLLSTVWWRIQVMTVNGGECFEDIYYAHIIVWQAASRWTFQKSLYCTEVFVLLWEIFLSEIPVQAYDKIVITGLHDEILIFPLSSYYGTRKWPPNFWFQWF